MVNRALDDGESITQFEAATAAAFVALASAGVEFGVIEAGLGGRLDATNVIPSRVTALTSVGLDHTEWLGETEEEIAAEKLAVLRERTTLVLGRVSPRCAIWPSGSRPSAAPASSRRRVREGGQPSPSRAPMRGATSPSPRRPRGRARRAWTRIGSARSAAGLELPGRMQVVGGDPPLVLDAAHNPDGARALAEALPEVAGGRPVVACLAILADKDAAGILEALAPRLELVVCTELPAERLARARARPVRRGARGRQRWPDRRGRRRRGRGDPATAGGDATRRSRRRASAVAWRSSAVRTTF